MPRGRRTRFCADVSASAGEPIAATASTIENWIVVEYRGLWARRALGESLLSDVVKRHLRAQLRALPASRLLFVRQPSRRSRDGFAVFACRSEERAPTLNALEIEAHDDLVELDFTAPTLPGRPAAHPLLVVCTHGKRDPCCARYGRPLYESLREQTDEGWVWQSSHVGGDRFAGNVVCLPEALYFGRVTRLGAVAVLAEYLAGRIDLDHYRGRSCYPFPVQAAERAVREATGLTGIFDLAFEASERTGPDSLRVVFEAAGSRYEVDVTAELGDLVELTCSAEVPKRPTRYVARLSGNLPAPAA